MMLPVTPDAKFSEMQQAFAVMVMSMLQYAAEQRPPRPGHDAKLKRRIRVS
jgi:hypothetical protein